MSVVIKIGEVEATVTDFEWTSEDGPTERLLNTLLQGELGGEPMPWMGDADSYAADYVIEKLGKGEIVKADPVPEGPAGRVY